MARERTVFTCGACGHRAGQWMGRCPSCGAWGTLERATAGTSAAVSAASVEPLGLPDDTDDRLPTGLAGVDRVLGGGLVRGSVVLVAGEPGMGKSTLLLQLAATLSRDGRSCLYASGEESRRQVAGRARRIGVPPEAASFLGGRELPALLEAARAVQPDVLFVDSIQSVRDPEQTSLPGGPSQVRACADALVGVAKADGTTVILAGQVTKDGDVAGPRTLEHAVDVVCSFDGDARTGLRVLVGGKNRFGTEGEVAWFEMGGQGLREVDPAAALSSSAGEPGAAVAVLAAGRRALAVEVQALVLPTEGPPRRTVSGLDPRRFGMTAAVVERTGGLRLARAELYGTVAGGLRVAEPGADLAVAAALASAASGVPPPDGSAFIGEVALTGSVRPVPNLSARFSAAAAAGITTVFCAGEALATSGLTVRPVRHLREAIRWARRRDAGGRGRGRIAAVTSEMGPDQRF